jgi:flagellar biosynthesis protein FliR
MIGMNFGFGALEHEFWRLLFVMTRIAAALLAAPLFGATSVPPTVRVAVSGAIAVLVCAWSNVAAPPALLSVGGLVVVAGEVVIGLALGLVLQLAFAAPIIAAEVIGGAMGMGIATAVDPNTGATSPALGQYFTVVMTLVFIGMGAHLQWIGLIVRSYDSFPPGTMWFAPARLNEVAGFAGAMFATAVAIALPVTLVLMLVQFMTGVISRSAPSLNLFALGLPAGVLAGLTALILAMPMVTDQMTIWSGTAIDQAGLVVTRR